MIKYIVLTPSYKSDIRHGRGCVSVVGCSVISTARHATLATALEKYPNLPYLWLDDDVIITDNDIDEMFSVQELTGAGVVTGWYPIRGDGPLKLSNNRKLGGFHGRWSEITSCGAGCLLVMPWVWDLFPKETWLWDPGQSGLGIECPPAFTSRPSWDRINTTEDFDFCLRVQDLGVKIVSANNVSATHGTKKVSVNFLMSLLEKSNKLPSIKWCRDFWEASKAKESIVIIGIEEPEEKLLKEISSWSVDLGHPCFSPRFLCAKTEKYIITIPDYALTVAFAAKTKKISITYPEAKQIF